MKPIILYDEDINVNLNTCFGDEEDATEAPPKLDNN